MRKFIEVRLDIEALHCWANCDIEEVEYLKYPHRHTFQFLCRAEVTHGDRQIEFIKFKHEIKGYLGSKYYDKKYKCCNFGTMSCEDLAAEVLVQFNLKRCSVFEDEEFTGIVEAD